jgi:hypothetical protein
MRIVRIALVATLVAAPAPLAVAHHDDGPRDEAGPAGSAKTKHQLEAVRQATKRFKDVRDARRAGYVAAGECAASPEGGMGVHYTHPGLAQDDRLNIRRPEVLVYEPRGERRRLVAVEYFRADADGRLDTDDDRPYLFGRGFDGPMEGHEPGMPIHYDLHAWVWKRNPAGTFAMWNPRVECPVTAPQAAVAADPGDARVRTDDPSPGGRAYFSHKDGRLIVGACDLQKDGHGVQAYASFHRWGFQNEVRDFDGANGNCWEDDLQIKPINRLRDVYLTVCLHKRGNRYCDYNVGSA